MIDSVKTVLDKLDFRLNSNDQSFAKFFDENGYCVILKSDLVSENIDQLRKIIDSLIKKESWRGGWEGKEEYMKYKKVFQPGTNRLGNLFNKDELFRNLLCEKNILKIAYTILGDDVKIGALDMREPKKGTGLQDLHMDWIPKKTVNEKTQNIVAFIFLDEANENNGSMRVVPKTHKMTGWIDENLNDKSSHPDEIFLNLQESSIVLMDANLWHSGTLNVSGNRRRVLFLDIRRREIPQLLNQKIYLDEITQGNLTDIEKYLLGVGENDTIFEDRVHTAGNVYRKQFKTNDFVKIY
jgi:ectoine hydroxylase-related dioxygenase (phytanoyl-CoA dioxygenase family)